MIIIFLISKQNLLNKSNINNEFLKKLLNDFLESILVKERTKKNYQLNIKNFFFFLKNFNNYQDINKDVLIAYIKYLENTSKYSFTSINLAIITLKQFFKFLSEKFNISNIANNIKCFKVEKRFRKESLKVEEAKAILNLAKEENKRDYIILILLLQCALRGSELINIKIDDIHKDDEFYYINVKGKGHLEKDQEVFIDQHTYFLINEYINEEKRKKDDYLFIDKKNKNITLMTLERIVNYYFKKIGIKTSKITLHSLRHTAIRHLLKNNHLNLFSAQTFDGHSNHNTTRIYISKSLDRESKKESNQIIANIFGI